MMQIPLKSSTGFTKRNPVASAASSPAPIGGLNTRDPEASMKSLYATKLENFWPQERFISIRGGASNHIPMPDQVRKLGAWNGGGEKKLFAFTDTGAYDVTDAGDSPPPLSQAFTSGNMVLANYATSGGSFLVGVNGVDKYFYYKSPTWTLVEEFNVANASPAATVKTKDLTYVAPHQRALFFLEKGSLDFYYMPVDSITGGVKRYPLGGLFNKGGSLAAIGSWTIDSAFGPDDMAVFLTSEGQAAVYTGTNPDDANSWTLRGVFDIGEPLGQTPLFKLGGDILILTTYGLTSLTKLLKEGWTSSKTTLTDIIFAYFQNVVRGVEHSKEWCVTAHPKLNLLMINVPGTASRGQQQLAMNLVTGAWTTFTGWDTSCWELFEGQLYAGVGAKVAKMWTQSDDFGKRIASYARCAWTYLAPRARTKQVNLIRFLARIGGQLQISAGIDVDYRATTDYYPLRYIGYPVSRYDSDEWDSAVWSDSEVMQTDWITIPTQEGFCLAPSLRVFSGDATFQWSAIDVTYTVGGMVG